MHPHLSVALMSWVFMFGLSGDPGSANNFCVGGSGNDKIHDVQARGEGSVVVGEFADEARFGPGDEGLAATSEGGADAFIASYSRDGNCEWVTRIGGGASDRALAAGVDGDSNIYVVGVFAGQATVGSSESEPALRSEPEGSFFLSKLDSQGVHVWSRRIGGNPRVRERERDMDGAIDVAVDKSGNAYVMVWFQGAIDADPSEKELRLDAKGSLRAYIARFDASGVLKWARIVDGGDPGVVDLPVCIAIAGSKGCFLAGHTKPLTGGPSGLNFFVASVRADGKRRWAHRMSGSVQEQVTGVRVHGGGRFLSAVADKKGGVVLTGAYMGSVQLDPTGRNKAGVLTGNLGFSGCAARYDKRGRLTSVFRLGDGPGLLGQSVAVDLKGSIYILGHKVGADQRARSVFLARYGKSGKQKWQQELLPGAGVAPFGAGVIVDDAGKVIAVGHFEESLKSKESGAQLTAAGGRDGFVLRRPGK